MYNKCVGLQEISKGASAINNICLHLSNIGVCRRIDLWDNREWYAGDVIIVLLYPYKSLDSLFSMSTCSIFYKDYRVRVSKKYRAEKVDCSVICW